MQDARKADRSILKTWGYSQNVKNRINLMVCGGHLRLGFNEFFLTKNNIRQYPRLQNIDEAQGKEENGWGWKKWWFFISNL